MQDELNLLKTAYSDLKSSYSKKGILQHFKQFIFDNSDSKEMAESIKEMLNKYWVIFDYNKLTKIATILDSVSKLMIFLNSTEKDNAIASLKNIIV
ncbi:10529_t:CDS:2, partial [Dentiscutata erythropus]